MTLQSLVALLTLCSLSEQSDPSSVPQLAWQFVPVQKTINPILAFCKGDTVHFLLVSAPQNIQASLSLILLVDHFLIFFFPCKHIQVKKEENGTIHVIKQRQLHLSCDIISLSVSNLQRAQLA